jgi:hypothetical protein
MMPGVFNPV